MNYGHYFLGLTVEPFPAAQGFAALSLLASCLVLARLWGRLPTFLRFLIAALGATLVLGIAAFGRDFNHDEVQHWHAAWLMARGLLPFRNFWEHHSPLLWLLQMPLLPYLPRSGALCEVSRVLGLLLTACSLPLVLALARRLSPRDNSASWVVLLWLAALVPGEMSHVRPDLLGNFLVLAAFLAALSARGPIAAPVSGALIGLALSISPKHQVLALALPVAWLLVGTKPWRLLGLVLTYALGLALGLMPLLGWLQGHGLVEDFRRCVLSFNLTQQWMLGGTVPLIPLFLLAAWWLRRRRGPETPWTLAEVLLPTAALLSLALTLLRPGQAKVIYDLQMLMLLTAAIGAGEAGRVIRRLTTGRHPYVAGVLVAVLFVPSILAGAQWHSEHAYSKARTEIDTLMKLAQHGPVFGIAPRHPMLADDVVPINFGWQWTWLDNPMTQVNLSDLADRFIESRPSFVLCYGPNGSLAEREDAREATVAYLTTCGLLSPEDGRRLQIFFERNYDLVWIVRSWYWVRNDLTVPNTRLQTSPALP